MTTVHDALVACIARWLPVLEEAELRAVEADVLRRVIAAREAKIDFNHRRVLGVESLEGDLRQTTAKTSSLSVGRESGAETVGGDSFSSHRAVVISKPHDWPGPAEMGDES